MSYDFETRVTDAENSTSMQTRSAVMGLMVFPNPMKVWHQIATYLDDVFHELSRPGQSVELLS